MRYRIRAVQPDQYVVEKKGWLFWKTALWSDGYFELYPAKFETYGEAYRAMIENAEMRRQTKIRQDIYNRKVKVHTSQKPWYFNV